jgi:hypothetical protein
MPIHAGNARGSLLHGSHADLSAMARQAQGIPQGNPVEQGPGSTPGGLDIESLLAAVKSGQVSAESLMQILQMLMGSGQMPQAGNMASIQNAGQGGPQGGPGAGGSPIAAAMMGGGGGGQ